MPQSDWKPDVSQVARKIMSRTRDRFGNLGGTFSDSTTPTDAQVAAIITDVQTEVADMIGDDLPNATWDDAKNITALRAAMQIELDFFPDQVNTGRSIYPQLKDQYDGGVTRLQRSITIASQGDGTVTSSGASYRPKWIFPPAIPWLTKRF